MDLPSEVLYSLMIEKVGLETTSVTDSSRQIDFTKVVFPAPISPLINQTDSPFADLIISFEIVFRS